MRRATPLPLLLLFLPIAAHAKAQREVSYPFEQVWPAALRLLRVDEKHTIVEKDEQAGYILFELTDEGKVWQGSMELVRTKDSRERDATKVMVTIPGRPDYMGDQLLDKLKVKLREELGEPVAPPKKQDPPPEKKDEPPK